MAVCLLPDQIDNFKKALANEEISLSDLLDPKMTSEQRTEIFRPYAGDNAADVNKLFEQKLVLKNQMLGITNLFSKLVESGKYSKENIAAAKESLAEFRTKQQERILSPNEKQTFLNTLADKLSGAHISKEVAGKVFELSQKIDEARNAPTDKLSGVSDEYLKASADLRTYVASQTPANAYSLIFQNLTTTMRNFLLMNPSTPIKTFAGQAENAAFDFFTRRLAAGSVSGLAGDAAKEINQQAWATFRSTGVNTLSMTSLDQTGKLGEGKRFDIPRGMESKNPVLKTAESATRALAKWTSKVAIDWEHNIAFTKFYQKTFLDMANIRASKMAGGDVAKAEAILRDAARIEPKTDEGKIVRQEAQFNAARVTGVTNTLMSDMSSTIVKKIDAAVPGLGNFLFMVVKIPTNLISYGIENAGGGLLTGPMAILQGRKMMASDDPVTRYKGAARQAQGLQTLIRTVGVMTASMIFANSLRKEDFKTDRYGNSYVNIGGTWINMNYFYAIDPSLAGMMEIKKSHPQNAADVGAEYVSGMTSTLRALPVVDTLNTIISDVTNPSYKKGIGKYVESLGVDRLQPSFLRQLENAKGLNSQFLKGLFFSTTELPTRQEMGKLGAK